MRPVTFRRRRNCTRADRPITATCYYVISRGLYGQGVPDLIDALLQAARTDTSKWVRDTIARYLGKDMPAPITR